MADYRQGCGCWTTHTYPCRQAADYDKIVAEKELDKKIDAEIAHSRTQGFVYIGTAKTDGKSRKQMLWGCRRGCGTVVWNIEDHIKNVCTEFRPVANG